MRLSVLLSLSLLTIAGFASEIGYKYLGRIPATSPAFVKVEKLDNQPEFLLISSFGALISGKVEVIPNIAAAVKA